MSLYLNCAGTFIVNGIYADVGGSYENSSNLYTITQNGSIWELKNTSDVILYQTNNLLSLTGWTVVNGDAPGPLSYTYDYTICNVLQVTGLTGADSSANGIYNLNYTDPGGDAYYLHDTLPSTYSIEYLTPEEGVDIWALVSNPGDLTIGLINVTPVGSPPRGNILGGEFGSTTIGNIEFSATCSFLNCESTPPSGNGGEFFVLKNGNDFKIRKSNNSFYIRKT